MIRGTLTSFSLAVDQPESEKIILCTIDYGFVLKAFNQYAGTLGAIFFYTQTVRPFFDSDLALDLKRDGTTQTVSTVSPVISSTNWFYTRNTGQIDYGLVNTLDPNAGAETIIYFRHHLSTHPIYAHSTPNSTGTAIVYYAPRISQDISFSQHSEQSKFGLISSNIGNLSIANADGQYDLALGFGNFIGAQIRFYMGATNLQRGQEILIARGSINRINFRDDFVDFGIEDIFDKILRRQIPGYRDSAQIFTRSAAEPKARLLSNRLVYGHHISGYVPINTDYDANEIDRSAGTLNPVGNRRWQFSSDFIPIISTTISEIHNFSRNTGGSINYLVSVPTAAGTRIRETLTLTGFSPALGTDEILRNTIILYSDGNQTGVAYTLTDVLGDNILFLQRRSQDISLAVSNTITLYPVDNMLMNTFPLSVSTDVFFTDSLSVANTLFVGTSGSVAIYLQETASSRDIDVFDPDRCFNPDGSDYITCFTRGFVEHTTTGKGYASPALNRPGEILIDILRRTLSLGSTDINTQSFVDADSLAAIDVSLSIPQKKEDLDKGENLSSIIQRLNNSCLGQLYLGSSLTLNYRIFRPQIPTNAVTLRDQDLLSLSIKKENSDQTFLINILADHREKIVDVTANREGYYKQTFTSEAQSRFLWEDQKNVVEENIETYLTQSIPVQEIGSRHSLLKSFPQTTYSGRTKNTLLQSNIGDIVLIQRNRFDKKFSATQTIVMELTKIEKSLDGETFEGTNLRGLHHKIGIWGPSTQQPWSSGLNTHLSGYWGTTLGVVNSTSISSHFISRYW